MSAPTFSLLHATRGRPEKAVATMRMWMTRCSNLGGVEYIFACEQSDATVPNLMDDLEMGPGFNCKVISGDFHGSAPAWNAAYKASSGNILIQVSDDFDPPEKWDMHLLSRMESYWPRSPLVVAVGDGFRRDRLLTMLVCTRAYAQLEGCFLSDAYSSVFSDGEATLRAYLHAAAGRATVIEARDLVFEHRHHWRFPHEVKWDRTYQDQNAPERYEQGAKTFTDRNPGWKEARAKDGTLIVDWI